MWHSLWWNPLGYSTGFFAGMLLFMIFMALIGAAVYIYTALALMTIARKLRHPYPWLAWIPFANISLVLQLGGFHWAFIFLLFIPIAGWLAVFVLGIISLWRIYEARNYPGWFSLISLVVFIPMLGILAFIVHLIILGIVAWNDQSRVKTASNTMKKSAHSIKKGNKKKKK